METEEACFLSSPASASHWQTAGGFNVNDAIPPCHSSSSAKFLLISSYPSQRDAFRQSEKRPKRGSNLRPPDNSIGWTTIAPECSVLCHFVILALIGSHWPLAEELVVTKAQPPWGGSRACTSNRIATQTLNSHSCAIVACCQNFVSHFMSH